MQATSPSIDAQDQLRTLYRLLLEHEDRYHEFKQLLAVYPESPDSVETTESVQVREQLNSRIRQWVGPFEGLSAMQVSLWRSILIEERFNVTLSPWKESNTY